MEYITNKTDHFCINELKTLVYAETEEQLIRQHTVIKVPCNEQISQLPRTHSDTVAA